MKYLKQLKLLEQGKTGWVDKFGIEKGLPYLAKFKNNLSTMMDSKKYSSRVTLIWEYDRNTDIQLASWEQVQMMIKIETGLVANLESDLQAVVYYAHLGYARKEWRLYSVDSKETEKRINIVMGLLENLNFSFETEDDPDWTDYKDRLILGDNIK